jgi:hypothetical protein
MLPYQLLPAHASHITTTTAGTKNYLVCRKESNHHCCIHIQASEDTHTHTHTHPNSDMYVIVILSWKKSPRGHAPNYPLNTPTKSITIIFLNICNRRKNKSEGQNFL